MSQLLQAMRLSNGQWRVYGYGQSADADKESQALAKGSRRTDLEMTWSRPSQSRIPQVRLVSAWRLSTRSGPVLFQSAVELIYEDAELVHDRTTIDLFWLFKYSIQKREFAQNHTTILRDEYKIEDMMGIVKSP